MNIGIVVFLAAFAMIFLTGMPIAPPNLERAIEMAENGVRVMTLRNDVTNFKMLLAGLRKDVYIPLKKHFETV